MLKQIRHSLEQVTKPVARLGGYFRNSILFEALLLAAKIMFIGVVLGLVATVAVITFTLIMMVIL